MDITMGDTPAAHAAGWAAHWLTVAADQYAAATAAMHEAGCWQVVGDLAAVLAEQAEQEETPAVRMVPAAEQAEAVAS